MADEEFVVTPYEVRGKVDYDRLREQFGTQLVTAELLEELRREAGGTLHPLLERGVYFSHRDLAWALAERRAGRPFYLYSGRGPSGPLHLAHLMHFEVSQWLQSRLGAEMYLQITDDEKFWFRPALTRAQTRQWGFENLVDLLAVGFDPARTHVFFDTRSIAAMYPLAVEVAKRIPYSTVRAVFGFPPSANIGLVFYTALQTVPAFWPSWAEGRPRPCLIPCGIDQDPHFRVTRDVADSLGYPKPALLHSQMLPGLLGERVMSTTGDVRDNAVFLDDPPAEVARKVRKAFTGGRTTVEEQRRLGAVPEVCSVWALWRTRFAPEAAEFEQITTECRNGTLMCGDCKARLIPRIDRFLGEHRARRDAARQWAASAIIETSPRAEPLDAAPEGAGAERAG